MRHSGPKCGRDVFALGALRSWESAMRVWCGLAGWALVVAGCVSSIRGDGHGEGIILDADPRVRSCVFWRWPFFAQFAGQDALPEELNIWVFLEGFAYRWALHGEEFRLDSGHS